MYILNGKELDFRQAKVMTIINTTPDSFYDGGKHLSEIELNAKIQQAISEKTDVLDIGGYSTRPNAEEISTEEEIKRILPAIRLAKKENVFISLDTFRSEVARVGIEEGVDIINDVSGGELDDKMYDIVSGHPIAYVCMHMRGNPKTMQGLSIYNDIKQDVYQYFEKKIQKLKEKNIHNVILDLGFGFSKTTEQSFFLLNNLRYFQQLDYPILTGFSRKSIIYKTLEASSENALNGTTVLNTIALLNGSKMLRVHDTKEAKEVVTLIKAYQRK